MAFRRFSPLSGAPCDASQHGANAVAAEARRSGTAGAIATAVAHGLGL